MKKELRAWILLVAWIAVGLSPVAYAYATERTAEIEETLSVTVEPLEQYKPIFYDVPLSEELQLHIFKECEKRNIAPALIISMIDQESDFDPSKIGDNGKSFGIMQIQPKWHSERMERLGCADLLNPYQNITVGIDYIAWLRDIDSDLYWVLMAYNAGPSKATEWQESDIVSEYAIEVTRRANELQDELEMKYD